MEMTASEEEYYDGININPQKQRKSGMDDDDFIKCLQLYPCLLEKSQTPDIKSKKQSALKAMEKTIKQSYGYNMNIAQIKKKIDNMKARVKSKGDKKKTGNIPIILKEHEKQLLDLMDYKNNPVLNKIPGAEQCGVPDTSKDPDEDERPLFQEEELPGPSSCFPQFRQISTPKSKTQANKCSIIDLQREVLLEQKEIFALQKEKLLLEIEVLKRKLK